MNVVISGATQFKSVQIKDFDSIGKVHILMTSSDAPAINAKIGNLSELTTEEKSNLVGAINEINERPVISMVDGFIVCEVDA